MKAILVAVSIITFTVFCPTSNAQQNGAPLPSPAPTPASAPITGNASVTKKEAVDVNAQLVAARAATAKKDYATSEDLMLKATEANPNMILPWVELGLAQLGLGKHEDAERDFKIALGIDPVTVALKHNEDFYQGADAPGVVAPGATRASRNAAADMVVTSGEKRTPDVLGTAYASLGEIYIDEKKFADAKAAFDTAVKSYPQSAASYRHNETVFFFKAGSTDDQLASAEQAIALDPNRADMYYFKAQALVTKATLDPKTQKMVLPPGCAEAYQKYLQLDPKGPYSADAKGILAAVK
jgi:tetratricopeptide (TPR) repeat protein